MSLILGKCVASAKKEMVRLLVPQLKFDSFFNKHFRENDSILAHDPKNMCRSGDWVLARKLDQRFSLEIDYRIEKVVYEAGNIIDPLTNKKSLGYEYVDDVKEISDFFNTKIQNNR